VAAFADRFGQDTGNAQTTRGAQCTIGEIMLGASTTRTAGGFPARGQLLSITQNISLFAVIGTTYGGDGQTTFALPDLRAVAPNHMTYSICAEGVFPQS
jgi:microcystin-dependent protein